MGSQKRRVFLKQSLAIFLASTFYKSSFGKNNAEGINTILLRAGWDNEDAGAIADMPSVYRLIQKHVPNTRILLWPYEISEEVKAYLDKNFTNLKIIYGEIDDNNEPTTEELKEALTSTDLFIYSTGLANEINWSGDFSTGIETASLRNIKNTGIPYVILGIGDIPEGGKDFDEFMLFSEAADMVVITDSNTENLLKDRKIKLSKAKALPHFLLAYELKSDIEARKLLEKIELDNKEFITVGFDSTGLEENVADDYYEKVRFMVESWIEETGNHVLFIGNDENEIPIIESKIINPIAEDKKTNIKIYSDFILPDVEISVYEKARIVTSNGARQIIFAIQSKTPAFYFTDWSLGNDGQNSQDLGLKDYVVNISESSKEDIAGRLLKINKNYLKAILDISEGRDTAYRKLGLGMEDINKLVNKSKKEKRKMAKKEGKK